MNHIHTLLIILCCVITSTASSSSNTDYLASANDLLSTKKIEQWRNDIDFMQQQLEQRHIHLYHKITADAFDKELIFLFINAVNVRRVYFNIIDVQAGQVFK